MSRLEWEGVGQSWTYVPYKNTYHVIYIYIIIYIYIYAVYVHTKKWCVYVNLHYGSI